MDRTSTTPPEHGPLSSSANAWAIDRALVANSLRGDASADGLLLDRLGCVPRILATLNARSGSPLGTSELTDLAQDTFVLAWRKRTSFDGRASFEAWVYGVARFEFLNAMRRARRRPESSSELIESAARELDDDLPFDPETVQQALSELPSDESEAVRLRHYEGLSFVDGAERAGIPLATLKNRYYRGLERLATRLKGARPAPAKRTP